MVYAPVINAVVLIIYLLFVAYKIIRAKKDESIPYLSYTLKGIVLIGVLYLIQFLEMHFAVY